MQRNWYVICTKRLQEKKVTDVLTKKGIENFCPLTRIEKYISASKKMSAVQPLFSSYIFVFISRTEMSMVKKIPNVVNMMYWKSKPVIITVEEINSIKMMTSHYMSIRLEKTAVGLHEKIAVLEENSSDNKLLSIKHRGLSISLPSLGYRITALRESKQGNEPVKNAENSGSIFKKLNPLFLFGF